MNNMLNKLTVLCMVCMFGFTYGQDDCGVAVDPTSFDSNGDGILDNYTDYALNGSITGRVFSEYNGDYDSSADETSEGDYLLAYVGDDIEIVV